MLSPDAKYPEPLLQPQLSASRSFQTPRALVSVPSHTADSPCGLALTFSLLQASRSPFRARGGALRDVSSELGLRTLCICDSLSVRCICECERVCVRAGIGARPCPFGLQIMYEMGIADPDDLLRPYLFLNVTITRFCSPDDLFLKPESRAPSHIFHWCVYLYYSLIHFPCGPRMLLLLQIPKKERKDFQALPHS